MGYTRKKAVGGLGFNYLGFDLPGTSLPGGVPGTTTSPLQLTSPILKSEATIVRAPTLAPTITQVSAGTRAYSPFAASSPALPPAPPPGSNVDADTVTAAPPALYYEGGPPGAQVATALAPVVPDVIRGKLPWWIWLFPAGLGAFVLYKIVRRRRPVMQANRHRRRRRR